MTQQRKGQIPQTSYVNSMDDPKFNNYELHTILQTRVLDKPTHEENNPYYQSALLKLENPNFNEGVKIPHLQSYEDNPNPQQNAIKRPTNLLNKKPTPINRPLENFVAKLLNPSVISSSTKSANSADKTLKIISILKPSSGGRNPNSVETGISSNPDELEGVRIHSTQNKCSRLPMLIKTKSESNLGGGKKIKHAPLSSRPHPKINCDIIDADPKNVYNSSMLSVQDDTPFSNTIISESLKSPTNMTPRIQPTSAQVQIKDGIKGPPIIYNEAKTPIQQSFEHLNEDLRVLGRKAPMSSCFLIKEEELKEYKAWNMGENVNIENLMNINSIPSPKDNWRKESIPVSFQRFSIAGCREGIKRNIGEVAGQASIPPGNICNIGSSNHMIYPHHQTPMSALKPWHDPDLIIKSYSNRQHNRYDGYSAAYTNKHRYSMSIQGNHNHSSRGRQRPMSANPNISKTSSYNLGHYADPLTFLRNKDPDDENFNNSAILKREEFHVVSFTTNKRDPKSKSSRESRKENGGRAESGKTQRGHANNRSVQNKRPVHLYKNPQRPVSTRGSPQERTHSRSHSQAQPPPQNKNNYPKYKIPQTQRRDPSPPPNEVKQSPKYTQKSRVLLPEDHTGKCYFVGEGFEIKSGVGVYKGQDNISTKGSRGKSIRRVGSAGSTVENGKYFYSRTGAITQNVQLTLKSRGRRDLPHTSKLVLQLPTMPLNTQDDQINPKDHFDLMPTPL